MLGRSAAAPVLPLRLARKRRTRRPLHSVAQAGQPLPADATGADASSAPQPLPLPLPLPPRRTESWSVSVQVAAPQDVFQFSAAAGAGLPLWSPAGLALTVLALVAVCRARTSRGSAVHELASVLDARRAPADEEARTAAEETLEQLRARQQAEARRQAEEAAQEAARVAVQQRELEAEQARIQVEQAAAAAEREARQRVLDEERRVREEAAAAVRRAAEREEAERAAALAAEEAARRAQAEAERARLEAEQRRAREEDRKRRGITSVSARFKGELSVACVYGSLYEVTCSVRVIGSMLEEVVERREVRTADEFRIAVPEVCDAAANRIAGAFAGDARARSFSGLGPLTVLDDNELDHWARLLRVRVAADAEAVVWRLMAEAEVEARRGRGGRTQRAAEFALVDVRDVAPPQDEASVRGRIERAVDALGSSSTADAAALVEQVVMEERDVLVAASKLERARAAFYATALVLAYFLDCAAKRPDATLDGLAECASFASDMLVGMQRTQEGSTWNSFFLDGGERLAFTDSAVNVVKDVVGEAHPLAKLIDALLLPSAKAAAAAEEEDWPDEAEVRAARIADAQQAAPVPERVWAMRNAAATLAVTGARSQAVDMLMQAITLKAEWLGSDAHPGLLGELCDLHDVLDDPAAVADCAARILCICEAVAQARAADGRTQEAVEILEGAVAEYAAASMDTAQRLQAQAAALGSDGHAPLRTGIVRALAVAAAPQLEPPGAAPCSSLFDQLWRGAVVCYARGSEQLEESESEEPEEPVSRIRGRLARVEDLSDKEDSDSDAKPEATGPPWKCALCPKARALLLTVLTRDQHLLSKRHTRAVSRSQPGLPDPVFAAKGRFPAGYVNPDDESEGETHAERLARVRKEHLRKTAALAAGKGKGRRAAQHERKRKRASAAVEAPAAADKPKADKKPKADGAKRKAQPASQ